MVLECRIPVSDSAEGSFKTIVVVRYWGKTKSNQMNRANTEISSIEIMVAVPDSSCSPALRALGSGLLSALLRSGPPHFFQILEEGTGLSEASLGQCCHIWMTPD